MSATKIFSKSFIIILFYYIVSTPHRTAHTDWGGAEEINRKRSNNTRKRDRYSNEDMLIQADRFPLLLPVVVFKINQKCTCMQNVRTIIHRICAGASIDDGDEQIYILFTLCFNFKLILEIPATKMKMNSAKKFRRIH